MLFTRDMFAADAVYNVPEPSGYSTITEPGTKA